jgi:hypothetical protein
MSAGPRDEYLEAAGGQRFGGNVIGSRPIENDHGAQFRPIGVNQRAHAAEISFALLSDIGGKEDCPARLDSGGLKGPRNSYQAGESRAVV